MEKNNFKTRVVFRKYIGRQEFIALFPDEIADGRGNIMSYQKIGQHGAADYKGVIKQTCAIDPKNCNGLLEELLNIGYDVFPVKRKNQSMKQFQNDTFTVYGKVN
jgi:hypothetical protein